jgi:hypothetical protein
MFPPLLNWVYNTLTINVKHWDFMKITVPFTHFTVIIGSSEYFSVRAPYSVPVLLLCSKPPVPSPAHWQQFKTKNKLVYASQRLVLFCTYFYVFIASQTADFIGESFAFPFLSNTRLPLGLFGSQVCLSVYWGLLKTEKLSRDQLSLSQLVRGTWFDSRPVFGCTEWGFSPAPAACCRISSLK